MVIDVTGLDHKEINERIRASADKQITLNNCLGQRFIASGMSGKDITINGIPGNALASYFDGPRITVHGNAQDAVGDTMNDGLLVICGSSGDATGYGMRGGKIFIKDNAGYRCGIHMKAYQEKFPVVVVGGRTGSFLGEYQAGGIIIVLGIGQNGEPPVGYFTGTGMHGGRICLRCDAPPSGLPIQVKCLPAGKEDMELIKKYAQEYCSYFGGDAEKITSGQFYVLTPNSASPYNQLYVQN